MKKIAFLCATTILLLTGCGDKEKIDENMIAGNKSTNKVERPTSITFNLSTPKNKAIKLTQSNKNVWSFQNATGKVVMLDFFGTWCPPCKAEIPHLNNIREKFGKDFEIIGIDIGQRDGSINSNETLIEFLKDFSIKYPVVVGGDNSKLFSAVSQLNPSGSIPFMVLFDKKGNYLTHYVGMVPQEMIESDIKKAIKIK